MSTFDFIVDWDLLLSCVLCTFDFIIRYGPLRRPTSSSCGKASAFGRGFFRAKKGLIMMFVPILGHFWCSVVTLGTFRSYLNNFEKIFLEKIDIGQTGNILKEKANCFTEKEVVGFRSLRKISRVDLQNTSIE